jgi:AI-2 transport protein TqsA
MNKIASTFIVIALIIVALIYGQTLLIPFIFALLVWVLIRGVRMVMDKNDWIKNTIPSWIKSLVASALFFSILAIVSNVLTINILNLISAYQKYEVNIVNSAVQLNEYFDIDIAKLLIVNAEKIDFSTILSSLFNSFSGLLENTFMIFIYTLFILFEEAHFSRKIKMFFADEQEYLHFSAVLITIENSVTYYLGLKTLVSILTGVLSYIALLFIGVDSPIFWAFLIFILNYIPTIGSLLGTLCPALFCILQFGEFSQCFLLLGIVGAIQLFIGNVVEPKLMGNSLNISSLVAIVALAFWGSLWGITGMVLSIPITVILIIILSQLEQTKRIAILLSAKGVIN